MKTKKQYAKCHVVCYDTYDALCCLWSINERMLLFRLFSNTFHINTAKCIKYLYRGIHMNIKIPISQADLHMLKELLAHENFDINYFCKLFPIFIVDSGTESLFRTFSFLDFIHEQKLYNSKMHTFFTGLHLTIY